MGVQQDISVFQVSRKEAPNMVEVNLPVQQTTSTNADSVNVGDDCEPRSLEKQCDT